MLKLMDRREFIGQAAAVLGWPALAGRVFAQAEQPADSVVVKVAFDGQPPERAVLDCGSDPVCARLFKKQPLRDETVVVGTDGGLQNVFVYVAQGLAERKWKVPDRPVILDQNCRYIPHVFGLMAGQPLQITNGSSTLEVPHLLPAENQEESFKLVAGASKTITLPRPEMGIRLKCDVHPWELAYCHVLSHPFYAVTDAHGKCALKALEPGEYELSFWHEKLGSFNRRIRIEAGKAVLLEELTSKEFKRRRPTASAVFG